MYFLSIKGCLRSAIDVVYWAIRIVIVRGLIKDASIQMMMCLNLGFGCKL